MPDESLNYDPLNILPVWYNYSKSLICELFSIFVSGNFLSARSITRTLIETYIYINIFKKEKSEKLLSEWYIWSTLNKPKGNTLEIKNKYHILLEPHCKICGKDFDKQWEFYQKTKGMYVWLKDVIKTDKINTCVLCKHINDPEIYEDYSATSSFVHGQDITSKITPFTFYDSIVCAFYMMMDYIFKTICLFPVNEERFQQIEELRYELYELFGKYCK